MSIYWAVDLGARDFLIVLSCTIAINYFLSKFRSLQVGEREKEKKSLVNFLPRNARTSRKYLLQTSANFKGFRGSTNRWRSLDLALSSMTLREFFSWFRFYQRRTREIPAERDESEKHSVFAHAQAGIVHAVLFRLFFLSQYSLSTRSSSAWIFPPFLLHCVPAVVFKPLTNLRATFSRDRLCSIAHLDSRLLRK